MAINLQGLLHNKPALIGLGVAGAAGLYVLVKRKQTTGSSSADTGAAATGTTATLPTYPNTTGTDVASWLGSQEGVLAAQNSQFLDQLQQTLGTAGAGGTSGGTTGTITEGQPLNDVLSKYNITLPRLLQLNPQLASQIKYTNAYGYVTPAHPEQNGQAFNVGTGGPETILLP